MRRQRGFEAFRIAVQDPGDLGEAEAQRPQGDDLRRAAQVLGTIGAPSRLAARRRKQAALLVESQRLGGDAEAPGGVGGVQEFV